MTDLDFESRFYSALKSVGVRRKPDIHPPLGGPPEDPLNAGTSTEEVETVEGDEQIPPPSKQPSPVVINFFQHPDAHPLVLDLVLLRRYGPEWMTWEPETLELQIPRDFRTSGVSSLTMEKLMAVRTLHFVDTYWKEWEVFGWCTMPFNSLFADFDALQAPTYAQCAVSVDTANRIRQDVKWSDEVKRYMGAAAKFDGVLCPFPPLDFLTVDAEGLPVDCAAVRERWPAVRQTDKAPTEQSVTAEQLRRALSAYRYLEESRQRLRTQLPMVLDA